MTQHYQFSDQSYVFCAFFFNIYNQPYVFLNESCAFISDQALITVEQPVPAVRKADASCKIAGVHNKTTDVQLKQSER